jgi:cytochrome oxidase Cu insertion factor (SCO1/SenC/PrrC family)
VSPVLSRRAACLLALSPLAAQSAGDAAPAPGGPRVEAQRLPAPGSYTLPRIQRCPDGEVLQTDGRSLRLHAALRGRISVLGFMYTYCRDPVGCPLAYRIMVATRDALMQDAALSARAQLVSLSFDPSNDTPEQMRRYGHGQVDAARVRWRFLTTASVPKLLPLLDGLGQDVSVETDARGRPTRTLNHLLKVFLIDPQLWVREIYSVATLDVATLVNDLQTVSREHPAPS